MIVCICRVVSDRTIRNVVAAGADSLDKVAAACRAGTGCGACREQIAELIEDCRATCANAALCAGGAAARPAAHGGSHTHMDSHSKEAA